MSIVKALTRRTPLAPGVDAAAIAGSERCAGFSGADMAALVREATICALKVSQTLAYRGGPINPSLSCCWSQLSKKDYYTRADSL